MADWFDEFDEKQKDSVTDTRVPSVEKDTRSQVRQLSSVVTPARDGNTPRWSLSNRTVIAALVGSVLMLVVLAAVVIRSMISDVDSGTQAAVSTAQASSTTTVEKRSDTDWAGSCRHDATIVPTTSTLYGAIAQFQEAYYDRDVSGLTAVLADNSKLHDADWSAILDKAAPDGTTWCVEFLDSSGSTAMITLTVTTPGGQAQRYSQRVTGTKDSADNSWRITRIDAVNSNAS